MLPNHYNDTSSAAGFYRRRRRLLSILVMAVITLTVEAAFHCHPYHCRSASSAPAIFLSNKTPSSLRPTRSSIQYDNDNSKMVLYNPQDQKYNLLLQVLKESLQRILYVMHHARETVIESPKLQTVLNSNYCRIDTSTIANAGNGIFATQHIPPHTIVTFYPIHSLYSHIKTEDNKKISIAAQMVPNNCSMHTTTNESSYYRLKSSQPNLPLQYGNDQECCIQDVFGKDQQIQLVLDVDPQKQPIPPGWYGCYINDAATLANGTNYYLQTSLAKQNIFLLNFPGIGPFQVAVTSRTVKKGEEFFVSYGDKYWKNHPDFYNNSNSTTTRDNEIIISPETKIRLKQNMQSMQETMRVIRRKYKRESLELIQLMKCLGQGAALDEFLQAFDWTIVSGRKVSKNDDSFVE